MNWRPVHPEPIDQTLLDTLKQELPLSEPFLRVLIRRGLTDPESIERFLHPEKEPLPKPDLLLDMDVAVKGSAVPSWNGKRSASTAITM